MSKIITVSKLVGLIVFTTIFLSLHSFIFVFIGLLGVGGLAFLIKSRVDISLQSYSLLLIAGSIILFQLVFNHTTDVMTRLALGCLAAAKITTVSWLVFIFTGTTSFIAMLDALCFLPKRYQLALTMTFTLVPVLIAEAQQIKLIQSARGLSRWWLNPFTNSFSVIIPLLHRSLSRAERIAIVLSARGVRND